MKGLIAPLFLVLIIALQGTVHTQEINRELVRRGRAEAETLWRRGFTLGDQAIDSTLQTMLDALIARRTVDPALKLQVRVFRSPDRNAFALPDGSMFVFAGLLAAVNTWDQVAFILAHEAQHPIGLHAQRYMSQAKSNIVALQVLSIGASVAIGSSSFAGAGLVNAFAQLGLGLAASATINGYGRDLEREADSQGYAMQTKAGYDPCAGVQSLHILLKKEGDESRLANVFWGNHPRLRERIETIRSLAPERCISDSVGVNRDYAAVRHQMQKLTANLWLGAHQYKEAAETARAGLIETPDDAEMHYVLAETYAVSSSQDTVQLAVDEFNKALSSGGDAYRLPLEGLARIAVQKGDTAAAVSYLERYLGGGISVPNRRAVQRRLDFLRTRVSQTMPVRPDTSHAVSIDSLNVNPADTTMNKKEGR